MRIAGFAEVGGHTKLKQFLLMAIIYAVLLVIVIYPVGRLLLSSFKIDSLEQTGDWTFKNFPMAFTMPGFVSALYNTFILAVGVVFLSTSVGVFLAWLIARTDMPFKKVLEPLNMVPFYLSTVVGALSWQILVAPRSGILNLILMNFLGLKSPPFNIYTLTGMTLVSGIYLIPFVYLFTVGSFQNMDPALEDAARMSGASNAGTMLRITFPLATPAIISAGILVFILMMGNFAIPLVLGGPGRIRTLSTLIWSTLQFYPARYNMASSLSCVLFVITIMLVIVQYKILARRHFWTVTGKGFRPRLISLGRWRWFALSINLAYLIIILVPFLTLMFVSFVPGWAGGLKFPRLSLSNYYSVLFVNEVTRRGLVNSTIISVTGATLGIVVALVLAAVIHRTRLPGRAGIDFIGMSPVAFPAIVLGVAFLIAWVKTPLYGTLWILTLAYVVNFLPTSLQSVSATLGGIAPDLDECARMSGASWLGAIRHILVPLMWPGLISTWLLLFVVFMREISSSMMLYVHGTETISIALIGIMEYDTQGASAAFGVLLTLIVLVCVYFFRKLASMMKGSIGIENVESGYKVGS
jgi:iron(III) transport system permease protein